MPRLEWRHALQTLHQRAVEDERRVDTASPHNSVGMYFAFIMLRTMPTTAWFRRPTTPFCCGEVAHHAAVNAVLHEFHQSELASTICPQHLQLLP